MNREALMKILPHRDDMLLLDEATLQEDSAVGSYRVRGDEFFLRGHFPGNPVVPGVILLEILAQSACVLMQNQMTEGKTPYYTGLDKVRFRNPVRPGEVISTECRLIRAKPPFYFAEGKAMVGDKLCAKAEFSFAIMGE
ncbi:MAG: beta-hydroxyacyl-ACP dehydratase [Eubacteriales bacterium]|nr:beta-hydroxyacyl-ACP dehydratase [Eubacteriales bacterium]